MAASIAFNFSSNGSEMYMTGSGWKSGEEVTVYVKGAQSVVMPADPFGNIKGQVKVPAASATYACQAVGNTSGLSASASYTVS